MELPVKKKTILVSEDETGQVYVTVYECPSCKCVHEAKEAAELCCSYDESHHDGFHSQDAYNNWRFSRR